MTGTSSGVALPRCLTRKRQLMMISRSLAAHETTSPRSSGKYLKSTWKVAADASAPCQVPVGSIMVAVLVKTDAFQRLGSPVCQMPLNHSTYCWMGDAVEWGLIQ